MNSPDPPSTIRPARFECFGVKISITSNRQDIVDEARMVAYRALLNNTRPFRGRRVDFLFDLPVTKNGWLHLIQNGEELAKDRIRKRFFHFFDSMIRVAVGERAVDHVFLHAGVVGWKGKAIILPADSFMGKSTLVAELVRRGADYYSDEYAVVDARGFVHPFARPVALRTRDGKFRPFDLTVESLGGKAGTEPIPIGLVLMTEYRARARWCPKFLTGGEGVLEMIKFTLPLRYNPVFSLQVLNKIASRAIIAFSYRGNAENFSKTLLNFVDKHKD
jgi:hypothetical protein